MENLRLDLLESADTMEEDEFYEEIEAPKFVDFTTPDRSRPDGRSWFCVRVGCDQNHEEVDPDALYKSFVLRVMAARSPNVGLRKALNRQAPRSMAKCPHSAPAKSAKDKISKFSTTSIPEKMAKTELKDHPISTLRSTPSKIKAKVQPFPSEKALPTPRNKKCSTNQEPFRSVKYQKAPIGTPKNRRVAKALFLTNTKKTDETRTPLKCHAPASEVCTEMRPNIRCRTKNVPSRYLCKPSATRSSKRTEETAKCSKKKIGGCSQICNPSVLREGIQSNSNDTGTDGKPGSLSILATDVEEHFPPSVVSSVKESLQSATTDATTSNKSKTPENSKDNLEKKVSMNQSTIGAASETRAVENATDQPSATRSSKRTEETAKSSKKKIGGCSQICNPSVLREGIQSNSNDTGTDAKPGSLSILATDVEEHFPPSVVSSVKESLQSATTDATTSNKSKTPENSKDNLEKKVSMNKSTIGAASETQAVENATDLDNNKENASYSDRAREIDSNAANSESENLQSETCETVPHKAIRAPIKSLKEPSDQGGKHRRTTNPKPFRFRTDERGILKEANLERRQTGAQKETTTIPKHGEGLQKNGKPFNGLVKQTAPGKGVHNAQPNLAKPRQKLPMQLVISKGKASEQFKDKTHKLATTRQTAKSISVTTSRKLSVSQSGRENHKIENAAMSTKAKRPTTVPKEPNFHRINLPKGCTKKPQMG